MVLLFGRSDFVLAFLRDHSITKRQGEEIFQQSRRRCSFVALMGSASLKRERQRPSTVFLWLFLGSLTLSLLVHLVLLSKARSWRVMGFSAANYDSIVPRTFRMKRVEIDPKTLEEAVPTKEISSKRKEVVLQKETPALEPAEKGSSASAVLKAPSAIVPEEKSDTKSAVDLMKELTRGNPMESVNSAATSVLDVTEGDRHAETIQQPRGKGSGNAEEGSVLPRKEGGQGEFSNLEQLLAGNEKVGTSTAPILMPTDLLFEYDSDTLKPAAFDSLAKLGALIARNAQASFRIEGHTDSFGSDLYNRSLSLRRAEAVKSWLHQRMGIDASLITTEGMGKKHLLVPASGSVEEQQLNRRVEIVITTL